MLLKPARMCSPDLQDNNNSNNSNNNNNNIVAAQTCKTKKTEGFLEKAALD